MDSLTQIALGSAVGYAVMGNKVGRKAAIYGAVLGTLPDLDVFINFGGPVEDFTFHRSFSHSFLMQLLISPLLAWLFVKSHPKTSVYKTAWFYFSFLTLSTHALLDSFTVYGTQFFWPISEYPFGFSTLFIIDPLYTIPLLVPLIAYMLPNLSSLSRMRCTQYGLALSCLYLCWSLGAKWHIDTINHKAFASMDLQSNRYVSTPAPLTTLLWRSVLVSDTQYYEVFTSIFDAPNDVSIQAYPRYPNLLVPVQDEWGVKRLQWFTKGIYSVKQDDDGNIVFSDLRMGLQGAYVFSFVVAKPHENTLKVADFEHLSERGDISQLKQIWERIFDPQIVISQAPVD